METIYIRLGDLKDTVPSTTNFTDFKFSIANRYNLKSFQVTYFPKANFPQQVNNDSEFLTAKAHTQKNNTYFLIEPCESLKTFSFLNTIPLVISENFTDYGEHPMVESQIVETKSYQTIGKNPQIEEEKKSENQAKKNLIFENQKPSEKKRVLSESIILERIVPVVDYEKKIVENFSDRNSELIGELPPPSLRNLSIQSKKLVQEEKVEEDKVEIEKNPEKIEKNPEKIEKNPEKIEKNPEKIEKNPEKIDKNPEKIEKNPKKIKENSEKIEKSLEEIEENPEKAEEDFRAEDHARIDFENLHINVHEEFLKGQHPDEYFQIKTVNSPSNFMITSVQLGPFNSGKLSNSCPIVQNFPNQANCYFCQQSTSSIIYMQCPTCPYFRLCLTCNSMPENHPHSLYPIYENDPYFQSTFSKISDLGFTNSEKITEAIVSKNFNLDLAVLFLLSS